MLYFHLLKQIIKVPTLDRVNGRIKVKAHNPMKVDFCYYEIACSFALFLVKGKTGRKENHLQTNRFADQFVMKTSEQGVLL